MLVVVREISNIRGKISLILRFLYNLRFVTCKLNLSVFAKLRSPANHVFISSTVTFATFAVNFNFRCNTVTGKGASASRKGVKLSLSYCDTCVIFAYDIVVDLEAMIIIAVITKTRLFYHIYLVLNTLE